MSYGELHLHIFTRLQRDIMQYLFINVSHTTGITELNPLLPRYNESCNIHKKCNGKPA